MLNAPESVPADYWIVVSIATLSYVSLLWIISLYHTGVRVNPTRFYVVCFLVFLDMAVVLFLGNAIFKWIIVGMFPVLFLLLSIWLLSREKLFDITLKNTTLSVAMGVVVFFMNGASYMYFQVNSEVYLVEKMIFIMILGIALIFLCITRHRNSLTSNLEEKILISSTASK
ncbi:MAG: hypothetical protein ACI83D_000599 [Planctomycetota bacterium]|jgi:hypothetical protein